MLRKLTSPNSPPVSVGRVKEGLRIDHNDEDARIERLIKGAVNVVEHETGRAVAQSDWEFTADCWFTGYTLRIPLAPVRDVMEVAYLDQLGAEQTVAVENWYWRKTEEGAEVHFVSTFSAPQLYDRPGSIIVRFQAGYEEAGVSGSGDDPELAMPLDIEQRIILEVARWFDPPMDAAQIEYMDRATKSLSAVSRIYR